MINAFYKIIPIKNMILILIHVIILILMHTYFTLQASRSHSICFVTGHSQ